VRWCNECCYWEIEGTTQQGQGGFDTWQAALDAALAWSRERYMILQKPWGTWWVFENMAGVNVSIATGPTKREAIRNAARTLRYAATNTNGRRTP
jgi:hypothetical protein